MCFKCHRATGHDTDMPRKDLPGGRERGFSCNISIWTRRYVSNNLQDSTSKCLALTAVSYFLLEVQTPVWKFMYLQSCVCDAEQIVSFLQQRLGGFSKTFSISDPRPQWPAKCLRPQHALKQTHTNTGELCKREDGGNISVSRWSDGRSGIRVEWRGQTWIPRLFCDFCRVLAILSRCVIMFFSVAPQCITLHLLFTLAQMASGFDPEESQSKTRISDGKLSARCSILVEWIVTDVLF